MRIRRRKNVDIHRSLNIEKGNMEAELHNELCRATQARISDYHETISKSQQHYRSTALGKKNNYNLTSCARTLIVTEDYANRAPNSTHPLTYITELNDN